MFLQAGLVNTTLQQAAVEQTMRCSPPSSFPGLTLPTSISFSLACDSQSSTIRSRIRQALLTRSTQVLCRTKPHKRSRLRISQAACVPRLFCGIHAFLPLWRAESRDEVLITTFVSVCYCNCHEISGAQGRPNLGKHSHLNHALPGRLAAGTLCRLLGKLASVLLVCAGGPSRGRDR